MAKRLFLRSEISQCRFPPFAGRILCGREFYVQIFGSKSLKFELTEQNELLKSTFDMLITNTIQK